MNIKELNLGEKIILIGCIVSIVSLFMPWVDLGIIRADGFQQQGYIVILFWLYPCIQAIRQKKAMKILSIILSVVSIIFMFYALNEKSTSIFGSSVNLAASGMYVMIASLIAILVGSVINNR